MSANDSMKQAFGGKMDIALNGVPCRIRPISMGDISDMEAWSLSQRIKAFRDASEGMDDKLRMQTMSQMTQEKTDENSMNQAIASAAGGCKLISLVTERVDGKEFIVNDLVDTDNVVSVMAVLNSFSGLEGDDDSPPALAPSKQ